MRKIIIFISILVFGMLCATVTSYAVTEYSGVYEYDFTKKSVVTVETSGVERAKFAYFPGVSSTLCCSSLTAVYLNAASYGYAATTITAVNNTSVHKSWGGKSSSEGWYFSPTAKVSGQLYAKSLYYYADLRASSNNISTIYKMYGY